MAPYNLAFKCTCRELQNDAWRDLIGRLYFITLPNICGKFSEKRGPSCRYGFTASMIIYEKFRIKWDFSELFSSKTLRDTRFSKWNLKKSRFEKMASLNFSNFFTIWNYTLQQFFFLSSALLCTNKMCYRNSSGYRIKGHTFFYRNRWQSEIWIFWP